MTLLETEELTFSEPAFFDIADRLAELYVSYRQRFVMMINGSIFIPKKKDSSPIPLSNSTICKHLNKMLAIGVFAGEYSSKFICFDVDDGNEDTVRKIIACAKDFGVPEDYVYVSSSGGKGYHVEIFFDRLVYTEKLRIFYDWVILRGKLDPVKVEFRPTKNQAIKLPLSRHVRTGHTCWFVNRDTFEPYTYDSYICSIQQFSADTFNGLVDHCGLRKSFSGGDEIDLGAMDPNRPKTRELTSAEKDLLNGASSYPDITEPGQRHFLMRSIAIHNRRAGMTIEESTEALIHWWENQDKSLTSTPDSEAIDDVHSLVAWTFSDSFIIPNRVKKLAITKDMLRAVLAQPTKTDRKFMFLLSCFCDVYGRMNMSYERISEYIKCSSITVKKSIPRFVNEGWIRFSPGKTINRDGQYIRKPNTYWVNAEGMQKAHDMDVDFIFEDPLAYEATEVVGDDEEGRLQTYIPELEPDGFERFYYDIIRQTLSKRSMDKYLTRSEAEALRNSKTA